MDKKSLDDILVHAEEGDGPPPAPPGGIPKQWLPSFIRWPIRVLHMPFIWLDLLAQKLAARIIRPPYRKEGECKKRGNCCYYILIPEVKGVIGRLNYLFNSQINGFFLRYKEPHEYEGKRIMVMGCRYLQKDGSCGHYFLRPIVCRKWPMIEYFGHPRILKGCGFRAIPRKEPPAKKSPLNILQ